MPETPNDADSTVVSVDPKVLGNEDAVDADRDVVENEQAKLREFIKGLSPDDIKSGGWFAKLIAVALGSYSEKITWQYFQKKYEGVPADGIVDQRIKMAARYAALEGLL